MTSEAEPRHVRRILVEHLDDSLAFTSLLLHD